MAANELHNTHNAVSPFVLCVCVHEHLVGISWWFFYIFHSYPSVSCHMRDETISVVSCVQQRPDKFISTRNRFFSGHSMLRRSWNALFNDERRQWCQPDISRVESAQIEIAENKTFKYRISIEWQWRRWWWRARSSNAIFRMGSSSVLYSDFCRLLSPNSRPAQFGSNVAGLRLLICLTHLTPERSSTFFLFFFVFMVFLTRLRSKGS